MILLNSHATNLKLIFGPSELQYGPNQGTSESLFVNYWHQRDMLLYLYLRGFIYMDFGQGLLFQGWKLTEAWNVDSYCLQNSTGYMGILG